MTHTYAYDARNRLETLTLTSGANYLVRAYTDKINPITHRTGGTKNHLGKREVAVEFTTPMTTSLGKL